MEGYIEKSERKNILFLADDCRLPSGIGTMTRELMIGNAHRFNFYQLGAALKHPEEGKIFDLSADVNTHTGLTDSEVIVYPNTGYGDPEKIKHLIERHKIDAIVHFTDPRYWNWLYRMSAELRQKLPIFYYHIWDDLPAPHYNKPFYQSCDLLMGISKQSDNIARLVLGEDGFINLDNNPTSEEISKPIPKTCYVPHGIPTKFFFPIDETDERVVNFKKRLFGDQEVGFVLFHNNRNIRRKMTSDVLLAFKFFHDDVLDQYGQEEASKLRLLLHTIPRDENGTDLLKVIEHLIPELGNQIMITNAKFSPEEMNLLYNCSDVCINIASNEGWGLSSTEAMLSGTPIINNVTGGLQDQCRFVDEDGNWIEFDKNFASNHGGKYKEHGKWVKPVFPSSVNLQGSIPTPYIFDDRCNIRDVSTAIMEWYTTDSEERNECGLAGREWAMSDEAGFTATVMCKRFGDAMTTTLESWKPLPRFNTYNVKQELEKEKIKLTGISI